MLDHALNPTASAPFARADGAPAGWAVSRGYVDYPAAVEAMEARAAAIAEGRAGELVWLLEHPPLYTAGVSAKPGDLIDPDRFPVFRSARGGQFTYHGPGQRVIYLMLDLTARRRDARAFVQALEAWVIETLARLGVAGGVREGRIGVWVDDPASGSEAKIAAIFSSPPSGLTTHTPTRPSRTSPATPRLASAPMIQASSAPTKPCTSWRRRRRSSMT